METTEKLIDEEPIEDLGEEDDEFEESFEEENEEEAEEELFRENPLKAIWLKLKQINGEN